MRRHLCYLNYLIVHKRHVFVECLKLGVPLAIFHDWTKLLPDEWFPYARCFYAPDGTKHYKPDAAFTKARLLHHHRNRHHWQFWLVIEDCGETECLAMPDIFRCEMMADWKGAAKSSGKTDLLGWYTTCRETMRFHPDTRHWIDEQLDYHKC